MIWLFLIPWLGLGVLAMAQVIAFLETEEYLRFITAFCGKLQPPNSAFTNGDPTAEAAMEAEINALRIKFDALRTQRAQP